jgi:Tol biopolymer transport system component
MGLFLASCALEPLASVVPSTMPGSQTSQPAVAGTSISTPRPATMEFTLAASPSATHDATIGLPGGTASPMAPPSGSGLIAFSGRCEDGYSDIYTMAVNGLGLTQLTSDPELDEAPAWSPDGARIAFWSTRGGAVDLYVMDADDSNIQPLTHNADGLMSQAPSWSPDRNEIVFSALGIGERPDIFILSLKDMKLTNLTKNQDADGDPAWSPDGARIAFSSGRDGANWQIYLMNTDGSNIVKLTDGPFANYQPDWSPDGSKIAHTCDTNRGGIICVMNADGSEQKQLFDSDNYLDGYDPSWSPDGTRIAFVSSREAHDEIFIMNADGSGTFRLTDTSKAPFEVGRSFDWGP